MSDDEKTPITEWIQQIADGNSIAEQEIWARYAAQVERSARRSLYGASRREMDEQDIAVAVMDSLFRGLKEGKIKDVESRRQLVALLNEMARRKSADAVRRQKAQKRGAGRVRGESGFGNKVAERHQGIENVADETPNPAEALARAESYAALLKTLNDETLRTIATLRLAKFSNGDIATRMGISERTVERKIAEIRTIFRAELDRRKDSSSPF